LPEVVKDVQLSKDSVLKKSNGSNTIDKAVCTAAMQSISGDLDLKR
jgi:hypothetical protein